LIEIDIPGQLAYRFEHLVLDLNGTISLDGNIIDGVVERLDALRGLVDISIVTADTRGSAQELGQSLQGKIHKIDPVDEQAQKLKLVQQLGSETTVSIGNGSNDASMLKESILGICVLGPEGTSSEAIANCDLVISNITAALDLLLKPKRLIATLRR
jgi:soluble P-type ATPase